MGDKKMEDEIDKYIKNKNEIEHKTKDYNNNIGNVLSKNKAQFELYKKENEELTDKIKKMGNEFKSKFDNKNKKENELKKINKEYTKLLEERNYNNNDINELMNYKMKTKSLKKIMTRLKKYMKKR